MSISPVRAQAQATCCFIQQARTDVHHICAACCTSDEFETASCGIWLYLAADFPVTHCMSCPTSCMMWPPTKRAPQKIIVGNRLLEQIQTTGCLNKLFYSLGFFLLKQTFKKRESHSWAAGLALAVSTCSSWSLSFLRGIRKQRCTWVPSLDESQTSGLPHRLSMPAAAAVPMAMHRQWREGLQGQCPQHWKMGECCTGRTRGRAAQPIAEGSKRGTL